MTELKKVIDDLGRVMACGQTMLDCGTESPMVFKMIRDAADNAIVFLKAQEPRLITVKDFENNPNVDHNGCLPAWVEYKRDEDWDEYWEDQPDEWGICRKDSIVYESMRYWTSRPTDEQRRETKWE